MPTTSRSANCLLALVGATSLFAAGCGGAPPLSFSEGPKVTISDTAITQSTRRRITVRNVGELDATVEAVRTVGFGPGQAFELIDENPSRACDARARLPAQGGSCDITVEFHPTAEGLAKGHIEVISSTEGNRRSDGMDVVGSGVLDCTISADLTAARAKGVNDASAKNQAEVARAKAAAAALTASDGQRDGYSVGYSDGYHDGYHGPRGYPIGQADGDADGYARGASDPNVCAEAIADADHDGGAAGFSLGAQAGYTDGYSQGSADGASTGYDDGYNQAAKDCGANVHTQSDPAPSDSKLVDACYAQGYDRTLDKGVYATTFDAARWDNPVYKQAYDSARRDGVRDGTEQGESDGYNDGYDKGESEGYRRGAGDNYEQCYQVEYSNAYSASYSAGYNDPAAGYPRGYDDAAAVAYDSAYQDGYSDGYKDYCR